VPDVGWNPSLLPVIVIVGNEPSDVGAVIGPTDALPTLAWKLAAEGLPLIRTLVIDGGPPPLVFDPPWNFDRASAGYDIGVSAAPPISLRRVIFKAKCSWEL
jgi:hypothetical protein